MLGFSRDTIIREGKPYLRRWKFECPLFSVRLHNFVGGDPDHVHDHPWSFLSLLIKGGYREVIREKRAITFREAARAIFEGNMAYVNIQFPDADTPVDIWENREVIRDKPMTWAYRHHTTRHRVTTFPEGCWTLVLTGPRSGRKWGFWIDDNERLDYGEYQRWLRRSSDR